MSNIFEKNAQFIDEFYTLQEQDEANVGNLSVYDGVSSLDKAVVRLDLEQDIIRAQWWNVVNTYDKLGIKLPEIEKMRKLLVVADARAKSKFSDSGLDDKGNPANV